MQESRYMDDTGASKELREHFSASSVQEVNQKMDARFNELEKQGHTLVKRTYQKKRTAKRKMAKQSRRANRKK